MIGLLCARAGTLIINLWFRLNFALSRWNLHITLKNQARGKTKSSDSKKKRSYLSKINTTFHFSLLLDLVACLFVDWDSFQSLCNVESLTTSFPGSLILPPRWGNRSPLGVVR